MTGMTLTQLLQSLTQERALLDVKEVAAAIGVTPWWVRRLIATGELRAINVGGADKAARWRVDPEDLEAWIRQRESRPRDMWAA